jgi:hypothetical protein
MVPVLLLDAQSKVMLSLAIGWLGLYVKYARVWP